MKRYTLAAVLVFILMLIVLIPGSLKLTQHPDEKIYVWKAWYYSDRILRLDFSEGTDKYLDPGFAFDTFWAWEQPFGSHIAYAAAMHLTGTRPAVTPYSFVLPELQGADTDIPANTLWVTRLTGIICASAGLALFTYRLGWKGIIMAGIMVLIPGNRDSFSRAWAEGPLLLGFGLCFLAYRSRWFPLALGATAAFKLTAFGLWPLMFLRGSCGSEIRWRRLISLALATTTTTLMTPVAWFNGGPLFVVILFSARFATWRYQNINMPTNYGVFFPYRYAWPFELLALLVIIQLFPIVLRKVKNKVYIRTKTVLPEN